MNYFKFCLLCTCITILSCEDTSKLNEETSIKTTNKSESTSYSNTQQPGYRDGTYPTTWPVDMANLNRSNTVVNVGLPEGFDPKSLRIKSVSMPFPTFTYTRDSNQVFVLGGVPYILDMYDSAIKTGDPGHPNPVYYNKSVPYLMKINPITLDTIRVNLNGGHGSNYVGGALVHENGLVYAVVKALLFKIDPSTMNILDSLHLPLPGLGNTVYNGLAVSSNGNIITKSTIFGTAKGDNSFILVDPDSLKIKFKLKQETASPRLTLSNDSLGNEYVYHLNLNYTYRMKVINDSLALDSLWMAAYAPYGTIDNEEPTSPVIAYKKVHYTSNTVFSAENPMKIFWQDTDREYYNDQDTLGGVFMFRDTIKDGYNFFHLSIDDVFTNIIIGSDQGNGKIAGLRIDKSNQLHRLWEKSYNISARPAIVADRKMVYLNH
ncbi:MAG: hypothetical protein JKY48_17160, partial [Flavobacteriales bacterium]|nr:hypothetical protein [Flavobacteriales bacterium]